ELGPHARSIGWIDARLAHRCSTAMASRLLTVRRCECPEDVGLEAHRARASVDDPGSRLDALGRVGAPRTGRRALVRARRAISCERIRKSEVWILEALLVIRRARHDEQGRDRQADA